MTEASLVLQGILQRTPPNCFRWSHLGEGRLGSSQIVCQALAQPLAFGFISVGFSVDSGCCFIFLFYFGILRTTWLTNGMPME